jgi:hypothetical protein
MGRKLQETLIQQARSLVLQQGLKGGALAQALGVDERTAREYAKHVRAEAERTSANGSGHDPTPPAAPAPVMVPLEHIHLGSETQARESIDQGVINEYVERMTEGDTFPPVTLFFDGTTYWIGDGYHRGYAASKVGFTTIRAEVRPVGPREARLYAAGANTTHGLRRTNADKRNAVMILLQDEEWRRWSDSRIARHCGVSPTTVGTLRASLSKLESDDGQRSHLTKHGTEATMNTSRIGSRAETIVPANGEPRDDRQAPLAPVMEPAADDDADGWDEQDDYTIYCNAWEMVSQAHAFWARNVHSGDGDRDRQFPMEVVKRTGDHIVLHIEELQETAKSLQDFAAALQQAFDQP